MPDVVKSKKVTFAQSLPMGERGTFTEDGEIWVAYRGKKLAAITTLTDRLLGSHQRITNEMVRWINERPQDAELIARVLYMTARAKEIHSEIMDEKGRAATQ